MTTIEDKLSLFAKLVFEKVEKQSEEHTRTTGAGLEALDQQESARMQSIARQILDEKREKAETKRIRILSQASLEARQGILIKQRELVDATIANLRKRAGAYTRTKGYTDYLTGAIKRAILDLDGEQQLVFYFTKNDIEAYRALIRDTIVESLHHAAVYTIVQTDAAAIGGCLCENTQRTRRVDCTMASQLADQRDTIGEMVMEKLQESGDDTDGNKQTGKGIPH